ncbi:MAG TPA: hypothetical protein VK186_20695 [Candidatus Deferrimicrobium sp.]|nr:hypothetical protein [Candidatus Deferrimicrobium sp.]
MSNAFDDLEKTLLVAHQLVEKGQYDKALKIYEMLERIHRGLLKMAVFGDNIHTLIIGCCLGGKGLALGKMGKYSDAFKCLDEAEFILKETHQEKMLGICLGNRGTLNLDQGRLEEALTFFEREGELCLAANAGKDVARSLLNQGLTLLRMDQPSRALVRYQKAQVKAINANSTDFYCMALIGQANVLWKEGDYNGALDPIRQVEESGVINEKILMEALNLKGGILVGRRELPEALQVVIKVEKLAESCGDKNMLQLSLGNQAYILSELGELEKARKMFKKHHWLCKEIGNVERLVWGMENHVGTLKKNDLKEDALLLYKELESIYREYSITHSLIKNLDQQMLIHSENGNFEPCIAISEEMLNLCKSIEDAELHVDVLIKRAIILFIGPKDRRLAMKAARHAVDMARQTNSQRLIQKAKETLAQVSAGA